MRYTGEVILKNGKTCLLRQGTGEDGAEVLEVFLRTHGETDFLLTYPEENSMTPEQEGKFLEDMEASPREVEICAVVDGRIVGTAGVSAVGNREKLLHRGDFGIAIEKAFWGLGMGRALTEACIACAREAGYAQLELEVVGENTSAIALYESLGFREFGRNPRGFRSRTAGWQELVYMRLELN